MALQKVTKIKIFDIQKLEIVQDGYLMCFRNNIYPAC